MEVANLVINTFTLLVALIELILRQKSQKNKNR